jgi:hypothetical protein
MIYLTVERRGMQSGEGVGHLLSCYAKSSLKKLRNLDIFKVDKS